VRLQEFTVIQQVSQMSHKPPVAQGNAVFEASKRKRKLSLPLPRNASGFPQALLADTEAILQYNVWLQCPRPNGTLLIAACFTYFC